MTKRLPSQLLWSKLNELAGLVEQGAEGNKIKEKLVEIIYGSEGLVAKQGGIN